MTAQAQQQAPATPAPNLTSSAQPDQLSPGSIGGTVVDETGAVVVGARVKLTRPDGSSAQELVSDEGGLFLFANVPPGDFEIKISAGGFTEQLISGSLHPGEIYTAPPVTLALAAVNTEIQVRPQSEIAEEQIKEQEKQRVLGVVPNFYVSYLANPVSLNAKQKFEIAWKTAIDPVTFALSGLVAGVEQAQGAFGGYGQGAQGYAKRFGAAYSDTMISTFIGSALLPSLFRQDPRYFYKGTGSVRSRFWYALASAVMCKGDNQRWQPNYSAILGGLAGAGISNLYYPARDRGAALVFENVAIGTGTTAAVNLLQEFVVKKLTPHASH